MLYYGIICYVVDRPKRVSFVNSVLAFHDRQRLVEKFPSMEFSHIFPEPVKMDIQLEDFKFEKGNVSFGELATLVAMVRALKPKVLFEFGTGDGNTTMQLAKNAEEGAIVYTLDLPAESESTVLPLDPGDKLFLGQPASRRRFEGTPWESRIRALYKDSALLETGNLRGKLNFIFVDGAHSYEYVENDTSKALEMLAPNGAVVWHDYMVWNDVTTYLNQLSRRLPLIHITGTSLVIYRAS